MDTISAGSTLACHSEIIGRRLEPAEILELLRGIALGRQKSLAEGSRRYAEAQGRPEASMSVKSLELPAYDPRGAYGMALAYAVATRGGCHLRAYPISHEILRKPVVTDRFSFSGKARIIRIAEDANAAIDSLGVCRFSLFGASTEEYAEAVSAVTGRESSAQDLLDAGERITFRDRMMNSAWGFTSADDDLPARFFTEPGSPGPWPPVAPIPRTDFLEAVARYYRIRGLDPAGAPLGSKVEELGLVDPVGVL
jgi:aldehyde:ferredoxin oxidoreductase